MAYIAKTRRCFRYKFDKELERGRLLDVKYIPRQIGKTEHLVELARQLGDTAIVQPTEILARYFYCRYSDIEFISVSNLNPAYRGKKYLLLDEGIKPKDIKEIQQRYKVIGGYIRTEDCNRVYTADNQYATMF